MTGRPMPPTHNAVHAGHIDCTWGLRSLLSSALRCRSSGPGCLREALGCPRQGPGCPAKLVDAHHKAIW
eukprot:100664-Chlamydomonas_euryale.AAC.3